MAELMHEHEQAEQEDRYQNINNSQAHHLIQESAAARAARSACSTVSSVSATANGTVCSAWSTMRGNVIKAALAAQVMRHGGLIRTVEHRAGRSAGLRRLLCKAEAREGFLIRRIERRGPQRSRSSGSAGFSARFG